jgi:hypothetical protein
MPALSDWTGLASGLGHGDCEPGKHVFLLCQGPAKTAVLLRRYPVKEHMLGKTVKIQRPLLS